MLPLLRESFYNIAKNYNLEDEMSRNGSDVKPAPSELELQIYREVVRRFKDIAKVNAHIYRGFESTFEPAKRETLAKKIQDLEEEIINNIAKDFNLTFDKIALLFSRVEGWVIKH